jgi:hypothetical protein
MRPLIALAGLILLGAALFISRTSISGSENIGEAVAIYDANPQHPWNQLYDAVHVREGPTGIRYGADSLDPLLWGSSKHLLAQPSHQRAMRVLDQFLQSHAENLINDPVKRAMLQRDLWAVFDWSVAREPEKEGAPSYDNERQELELRLVEVMRRLALTPEQIESLPDNYGQAVASGTFAKEYDPAHRERAFLPPDLFDPRGPWVCLTGNGREPLAQMHVTEFSGRSRFLVFIRLPEGRNATFDYLRTLWNVPQPWILMRPEDDQVRLSFDLPQFPARTQVALVRQMTLFDSHGNLVPAPVTESVQIRVYRALTAEKENHLETDNFAAAIAHSGQDVYEVRLSRPQFFANKAGGLRAVGRGEREFPIFRMQGEDMIEPWTKSLIPLGQRMPTIVEQCPVCHSAGGINSLGSREKLFKPNPLQHDTAGGYLPRWWENDETISWKQSRYDWGLLKGYWTASR